MSFWKNVFIDYQNLVNEVFDECGLIPMKDMIAICRTRFVPTFAGQTFDANAIEMIYGEVM